MRRPPKDEVIRRALNHVGVCITDGIPERILLELRQNGWRVKKDKKWGRR